MCPHIGHRDTSKIDKGTAMLDIRIQPTDDTQFQEILEILRPMGVDLVTGERDVLEATLFYIARMNSKLDNLGQLRHLQKGLQALDKACDRVVTHIDNQQQAQEAYKLNLYKNLCDQYKDDPIKSGWTPTILKRHIPYLTDDQIRSLFE
jgi:hypothetical protein